VIESPNSVVRRVSARVTNYKNADMALEDGFVATENEFRATKNQMPNPSSQKFDKLTILPATS
jgi:hypothetical protein